MITFSSKLRQQFEARVCSQTTTLRPSFEKNVDGSYIDWQLQTAWEEWKASARAALLQVAADIAEWPEENILFPRDIESTLIELRKEIHDAVSVKD